MKTPPTEPRFVVEEFRRNVDDEELLHDVKSVAEKLGKEKLTIEEYRQYAKFHPTTLTRRFSSWFTVLERAGLKKTRNLNISDDALFENLVDVWTTLGRQPRYGDMRPEISRYSVGTYEKRFQGWQNALRVFAKWADTEFERIPNPASVDVSQGRKHGRNINWGLRAQVLMRDSATCRLCGRRPADGVRLHVDHIVPRSRGGETTLMNLQILCEQCNIGKSDFIAE